MEHESQDSILTNLPPRIQHLLGANLKDLIMPANPLPPFQGLVNRNTNAIALNDRQHLLSTLCFRHWAKYFFNSILSTNGEVVNACTSHLID